MISRSCLLLSLTCVGVVACGEAQPLQPEPKAIETTPTSNELWIYHGSQGWYPSTGVVKAGALVRWFASAPSSEEQPLHVYHGQSRVETLDLSNGTVIRRFDSPGTYWYCSHSCYESGVIHVH